MNSAATEDWKKNPYLYLDKAEGWYNTNDELVSNNILDKVCGIYAGKYASTTKKYENRRYKSGIRFNIR